MPDTPRSESHELPDFPAQRDDSPYAGLSEHGGAPGGARTQGGGEDDDAEARPGGATQSTGGALTPDGEEIGTGPGRGAD